MACEVTGSYLHGLLVLVVPEAENVLPETRKSSSMKEIIKEEVQQIPEEMRKNRLNFFSTARRCALKMTADM